MSGGNAQKVAVARWLRIPLALLILDEPTQSIDVGAKADLMEAIRERARGTAMGVLWLESDIEEVVKYADRVIVMSDGPHRDGVLDAAVLGRRDRRPLLWT